MLNTEQVEFAVKGDWFVYAPEEECDDDCAKLYHYVVTPEGNTVSLPWSPYSRPTASDLTLWVQVGMPTPGFNLTRDHLLRML